MEWEEQGGPALEYERFRERLWEMLGTPTPAYQTMDTGVPERD